MLRPGENEPARRGLGIDFTLEVAEEFGDPLNFVDDSAIAIFQQKSPRVLTSELPVIHGLQRDIVMFGEGGAAQGGLSRLAWTGHGHHGIIGGQLDQFYLQGARNHFPGYGLHGLSIDFTIYAVMFQILVIIQSQWDTTQQQVEVIQSQWEKTCNYRA